MFDKLETIFKRPAAFEIYTAAELWTDEYTSQQMLACHLNEDVDLSSRNMPFIRRSVDWIVSHFGIGPGTAVADFGCGPGLYTNRLATTGAAVTGIDFSQRSLDHARQTAQDSGHSVTYHHGDYLTFDTDERYDLITMIMCDFCALGPQQRKTLLRKFKTFLKPGGSVLFDVYSLAAFEERKEQSICEPNLLNGFWAPAPYYGFLQTHKYDVEKVALDKYTIVEQQRSRTIYNWLQYFSTESLGQELAENGFTIRELHGNVAGAPYSADNSEFAVVATVSG